MKSYRLPAIAAIGLAVAFASGFGSAGDNPNVAAKAAGQQLSVVRLADILGNAAGIPVEKNIARSIATLWINYHLLGEAAARGDSLKAGRDDALWSEILRTRISKVYELVSTGWDSSRVGTDEQRYGKGEMFAARHILVMVDSLATPAQRDSARKRAESIRARVTPANFASLAVESDEPGAAERGGSLGMFAQGDMVPEFERAVKETPIGGISNVVETKFGFHVIYRTPFAEVAEDFALAARKRNVFMAESTFLASVDGAGNVSIEKNAAATVRLIARNQVGYRNDKSRLATFSGGVLTNARFADWLAAYPSSTQIIPQLISSDDEFVERFIRSIIRFELLLRKADSMKVQLDSAEYRELNDMFTNMLSQTWTQLGIDPTTLANDAKGGSRAKLAAERIEIYFDRVVKNEVPFVDMPNSLTRALQRKSEFTLNEESLDRVIERARHVRAVSDSIRAMSAPVPGSNPSAVPTPQGMKTPLPRSRGGGN